MSVPQCHQSIMCSGELDKLIKPRIFQTFHPFCMQDYSVSFLASTLFLINVIAVFKYAITKKRHAKFQQKDLLNVTFAIKNNTMKILNLSKLFATSHFFISLFALGCCYILLPHTILNNYQCFNHTVHIHSKKVKGMLSM